MTWTAKNEYKQIQYGDLAGLGLRVVGCTLRPQTVRDAIVASGQWWPTRQSVRNTKNVGQLQK